MTITTTSNKAVATGNGVTTVFPFTFLIPELGDLTLTRVDRTSGDPVVLSNTTYSVSGLGNQAGGSVTYPLSGSPLSSAYYLVIERTLSETQETDLTNQGGVYPEDIENALDYLTMLVQQLQDQINRSIVFSVADSVETTLPPASARSGKVLGFDSNGDPVALSVLTPGTTVSAAMIPVVTAPTTAAALTALGIPGSLLNALIPAGTVWDYTLPEASIPGGFAAAYGQPVTALWPVLRAALISAGSPYGTNGVDPLAIDFRSRVGVGKSNMGGVDNGLFTGGTVLGAVSGVVSVTLTLATIPTGITSNGTASGIGLPGNKIPVVAAGEFDLSFSPSGSGSHVPATSGAWTFNNNTLSGTASVTSNNTGGGAHENRQPSIIVNKIIKVH